MFLSNILRFLKAYGEVGIPIWGVTGQNEPTDGFFTNFPFQAMGWTPEMQRDFIVKDLGPALQQNSLGHVKIMILDDARVQLPYWAEQVWYLILFFLGRITTVKVKHLVIYCF